MDFTPRSDSSTAGSAHVSHSPSNSGSARSSKKNNGRLLRYATLVMLFSITILVLALASAFAFAGDHSESRYVNTKEMQAVFLNGGQVYFGNITRLNNNFITVSNVYYLRVKQAVQPNTSSSSSNDVSLVKLGCELHGPEDQMVINQSQVIFWENLKTDGQVAKAVTQFQKDNPNGQDCSTQSTSATPSTTSSTSAKQ